MILLDTSGLLAALFVDQSGHAACAKTLLEAEAPLVLSPFVLAELDYMVAKLAGEPVELELLAEVSRGAYRLADVDSRDVEEARVVIERHAGLGVGLAVARGGEGQCPRLDRREHPRNGHVLRHGDGQRVI